MPTPHTDLHYQIATQTWLKTVVIDFGLCPFAKRELERGSIQFAVVRDTEMENCLFNLISECALLDIDPAIETTLLIYAGAFTLFCDYLNFVEVAETLLIEQGYEGVYQLASFHPDYCFDGAGQSDPANYSNRSPYPMLHLLRESSIEKAISRFPDPESIPQENIELTRKLGLAKMQALLSACYRFDV